MSDAASWRASASRATQQRESLGALTRCKVIAAMRNAAAPLSIQAIAGLAGISYTRAHRALETLVALKTALPSGPDNNRRYQLAATGSGKEAGGPASESAEAAAAGFFPSDSARPGSVGDSRSDQRKERAA